jgi:GNAT superfamily N-acetyltransferase
MPATRPADARLAHGAILTPDLLLEIEAMSIRSAAAHWSLIPDELALSARPQVLRVGDALLTVMPKSDALRMNRVTGLGHLGMASEAVIEEIVARYRAARVKRFSVLLRPGVQAPAIESWLARRGFRAHGGHLLLVRDSRLPSPRPATALRVQRASRQQRETVVRVLAESFPLPPSRRAWAVAAAGAAGLEHYLAWSGRIPVAVAALHMDHGLAWLGGAATRTRWRRQGGQSALIAARLARAARAGCRWAWSETAAPARGRPDGSRRNLTRLGFVEAGLEPIWVWEA